VVGDQSADREITGHLPPGNLPAERSHPLPLTGNGGCWSAGSSWSACPAEPFQYGVDLAVCGLPRPAANLDQFDQSKEFGRVGSDVSSCRGRRPQKVLAYLFDLKAGCLEGQD